MDAAVLRARLESRNFDLIALSGLTLAVALYYFGGNLGLSLLGATLFILTATWRLDLALIFVVFSSPFYLFPKKFGSLSFSLAEFLILACGIAALLRGSLVLARRGLAYSSRSLLQRFTGGMKTPVVLFLVAATLTLFGSEFLKFSLREYRTVVLEPALFYFLLTAYATEQRQIWRLINAFLLLSAGVALFGIFHYYYVGMVESTDGVRRVLAVYHSPNALALFLGRSAPMFLTLALFYPAEAGRRRNIDPAPEAGRLIRPSSWTGIANVVGRLATALQAVGQGAMGEALNSTQRVCYALGGLAVLACLFITYSRGAWLGVGAALAFVALLRGRRYLLWTVGVAAAALIALIPLVGIDRLLSRTASVGRLYLWQSALSMIRDHPILGVGLDNFLYQYPRYRLKEAWAEPNISHPHNILLDFWTRTGVMGVAALVWLQAKFWQTGLTIYRRAADSKVAVLSLALMASMVGLLAHGLIDNSFFLADLAIAFWLIYGSIEVLKKEVA